MAKLMECKTCGGKVSSSATVCPHCGESGQPKKSNSFMSAGVWSFIILLSLGYVVNKIESIDTTPPPTTYTPKVYVSQAETAKARAKLAELKRKKEASPEYKAQQLKKKKDALHKKLTQIITQLNTFNKFNKYKTLTIEQLNARVKHMRDLGKIVFFSEDTAKKDKELTALWQQAKKLQIRVQVKHYPKMRDALGPLLRDKLWEQNMSVKTIGKGYRNIIMTAAIFANNAAIKQIHETMAVTYSDYRFKRADYKWIKHDTEWTYFKLNTKKDNQL